MVQFLNEQRREEATFADVEEAIARALVSGGESFANVWSDAGEQGRAFLCARARGEKPGDFPAAGTWLREHDVLNDAGSLRGQWWSGGLERSWPSESVYYPAFVCAVILKPSPVG